MKLKRIALSIVIVYVIGVVLLLCSINIRIDNRLDILEVNEIVKTTEKNWGHINQSLFKDADLDFTILDLYEKVIYSTDNNTDFIINDAIRQRATMVDVSSDGTPVGKIVFTNDYQSILNSAVKRVYTTVFLTFTVLALLCLYYILYIEHNVSKPFSRLNNFAKNIAAGNLNVPLKMDRNNLFGAFSESFDLMREELEKARKAEYEANLSKKELVASLSHDIKTPVSSIKAISELMLLLTSDEKEKQRLSTIYYKAEQINILISDMFQATLEELNELKITLKEELSTILKDIIHNVNYFGKISSDPVPECIIITDTLRLQQVFDNVLANSYKYADTPVYISFNINASHLKVNIVDKGKGVDAGELPLLFNKFHRGKNSEGQSGSGLGLYISKYLMDKMDGDISCCNIEGGFKVTLKIKLA